VFALDPDIPAGAQRIRFEGQRGVWVLDGRRVGSGASIVWPPQPGRHELVLLGEDGRARQTVRFEVRGVSPQHPLASTPVPGTPDAVVRR
jgi:penicillin-binding protein 1C